MDLLIPVVYSVCVKVFVLPERRCPLFDSLFYAGKGVYSTITFDLFHVGKGVCVVFEKYQNHVYPMWVKVFVKVFVYLYLLRNFYNIL